VNEYIVVDASIWVARLIEKDASHPLCRTWLDDRRAAGTRFLAPALLLVEVAAAISRRTGEPELARRAVDALRSLPDLRLVEMDQEVVATATSIAIDLGVRGADAFYIAIAQRLALPLATLDVDQRRRAERVVTTLSF